MYLSNTITYCRLLLVDSFHSYVLFYCNMLESREILDIYHNTMADDDAINEWVTSQSQDVFCEAPSHMKQTWGNKYTLLNKLGAGQFGSVYQIYDIDDTQINDFQRYKVLKFVSLDDVMLDETIDAVKEARLLSKLSCPYILSFHDSFIEDSMFCIVTEFCEGGDLSMFIKHKRHSQQQINITTVLDWFLQLVIALNYIHQRKIIHRDLKTRNVFLQRNRIKLGDFGISRMMRSCSEYASTFAGTPYYMSPEVLKQEGYNFKSDVWSLGCIFYELLMLDRPFTGKSIMSLLYEIVEADPPQLPITFSVHVRNLCKIMLEKDPMLRPSSYEILQLSFLKNHIHSMRSKSFLQLSLSHAFPHLLESEYFNQLSCPPTLPFKDPDKLTNIDKGMSGSIYKSLITPKEMMIIRKRGITDDAICERRKLTEFQFRKNVKLFENEKKRLKENPLWILSPEKSSREAVFPSMLFKHASHSKGNTYTLSTESFEFSGNILQYTNTNRFIPDDPKLAETHYLQNDDFEDYSESELECTSSKTVEAIDSEDEYDLMLYYLEDILHEDKAMDCSKDALKNPLQTNTLQHRVENLKNECLKSLGSDNFEIIYDFLKSARFGVDGMTNGKIEDEGFIQNQLSKITNNRNGCFLVDQLVFFERQTF